MIRHSIRHTLAAVAAVGAFAACGSAHAFTPPPFPRIAGVQYGSPFDYNDPTYQSQLEKQAITILQYWPGEAPGDESMQSIVQAIKSVNPNELVFLYTNSDEGWTSGDNSVARAAETSQLNSQKWWLYTSTSFSSAVPSFYGDAGGYTINNTPYTPKDSQGDDSIDWLTKWYTSTYVGQVPNVDGLFMDNVFTQPRVSGDWYRNGTVLAPTDPKAEAAIQAGYERWFQLAHQLLPGKYEIGNVATWFEPGQAAPPAGYSGMADGGLIEGAIGASWSIETWAGWPALMTQYTDVMQAMNAPKLVIFNEYGSSTDYQSMRYGLATCLMNDGYFSFTDQSNGGYGGTTWFDEYNANLGQETSQPPTAAWQKGVWRRDFTNGIALVNPKGNGPQTVQLGGTFVKLKGSQDPSVNNGQTVTSVTLQDRDGIILLRQSALQQPKAPTSVSASGG
jgi:Hypothetical glycosyl hydrolase family 15